jgi:hypothetical protein
VGHQKSPMSRHPRNPRSHARFLSTAATLRGLLFLCLLALAPLAAPALELNNEAHSIARYKTKLAATIRADHPAIVPVADAIRQVTTNPLEQLVMVNDVTHLLVDFDDDWRVYGRDEYHATLDEMIQNRREHGWLYLRDDCDGRAVFAGHLLASLGIKYRLEGSRIRAHAWVVATINGTDYDILDFQPEGAPTNSTAYKMFNWMLRAPNHPPLFEWRRAWAQRTSFDIASGVRLGLLSPDSVAGKLHERRATDWARLAPGVAVTPPDTRALATQSAGFPFGEPLQPSFSSGALASEIAAPQR